MPQSCGQRELEARAAALERRIERVRYGSLTLDLEPANAQVRLLNHKDRYRAGMRLAPGDYRVKVSAAGYETAVLTVMHGSSSTRREVRLRGKVLEEVAPGLVDRRRRAAEQGDAAAQTRLGFMYDRRQPTQWEGLSPAADEGGTGRGLPSEPGYGAAGHPGRVWLRPGSIRAADGVFGPDYAGGPAGVAPEGGRAGKSAAELRAEGAEARAAGAGRRIERVRYGSLTLEGAGQRAGSAAESQGPLPSGDATGTGGLSGKSERGWVTRQAVLTVHVFEYGKVRLRGRCTGRWRRASLTGAGAPPSRETPGLKPGWASCTKSGRGVGKDHRKAGEVVRKAAEQGYARLNPTWDYVRVRRVEWGRTTGKR